MRVLWTHNFDPAIKNNGIFIHTTAKGVRARGVDIELEYIGNLRSIAHILKAREHVKSISNQFDLVHAQYGSACAVVTAAAKGIPKILSIRGSDWAVYRDKFDFHFLHTRLARFMTRAALTEYDTVITVSNRFTSEVHSLYPLSEIFSIPSPINLELFVPQEKKLARAALGYPDTKEKWILFTALEKTDPVKRFSLAKKAFDLANSRRGNLTLRVATDIDSKDMPLFVAACDLILCTSENEGWPNSIKEALACNVPFVSTDVSDLWDIARQEPTCRICPADPVVLANNICDVLASQQQPDLRRHVASMSLDIVSARLVSIYESLLRRDREANGYVHPY